MESPNSPSKVKAKQNQEPVHHFLSSRGLFIKNSSCRPNSQFCILLWCFMATAWKCAKKWLLHHCPTLPFRPGNIWPETTWLSFPTHPTFASPIEDTERPPFWHNLGDQGRITGGAQNAHRTGLPGCIFNWQKHWEGCINMEGHYFEGDGGQ
jgi:hypothetical protein